MISNANTPRFAAMLLVVVMPAAANAFISAARACIIADWQYLARGAADDREPLHVTM